MKSITEYINEALNVNESWVKLPQNMLAKKDENDDEIEDYIVPVFWTSSFVDRSLPIWSDTLKDIYKKFKKKFVRDWDDKSALYFLVDYMRPSSSPYYSTEGMDAKYNMDFANQLIIIDTTTKHWNDLMKELDDGSKLDWWVKYRLLGDMHCQKAVKESKYPVQLTESNEDLEKVLKKSKIKYEIL